DPSLEQAAAVLGAGPWRRFRMVLLPLLLPGLTITFALSFVMAFAVFPSATLVGDPAGSTRVISIAAYTAYSHADYSSASAIAVLCSVAAQWTSTWLPGRYTTHWYADAWNAYGVGGLLVVTFEVALTVVALSLVVAVPIAYVLARLNFVGKRWVILLFLLPQ